LAFALTLTRFRAKHQSIVILSLYRLLVALLGGADRLHAIVLKQFTAVRFGEDDGFYERYAS
jgi:hypothetical protein